MLQYCWNGASGVCYERQLTQCYPKPSLCVALKGWTYAASHFSNAAERSGWAATTTTWNPGSGQNTEMHLDIMQWTWLVCLCCATDIFFWPFVAWAENSISFVFISKCTSSNCKNALQTAQLVSVLLNFFVPLHLQAPHSPLPRPL